MDLADPHRLLDTVGSVEPSCSDRDVLTAAVAASARLRAWLDGRDVLLAGRLADVVSSPEAAVAGAARCSQRDADRLLERSRTARAVPELADALNAGSVSGRHVDAMGKALRRLEPHERPELQARAGRLLGVAEQATPEEFDRALVAEVRRIQIDGGMARLERQKRATRLRCWIDGEGMWCPSGRFDPEIGLAFHGRLTAAVAARFAEKVPDHCPSDPIERQDFLRAHAILSLTNSPGHGAGPTEVVVVVDTTCVDPSGGPVVDWGLPVELPHDVLHRLFGVAHVSPVVLCRGAVIHAPGQVDLGRTTRLANRAQRRALRALYPTCAVPGCSARFDLCKLHHVIWWEEGGPTNLANLLPLCVAHHHAVHDRSWQLHLTPDRELTITYPDGTVQTTGPPRRNPRCHPRPHEGTLDGTARAHELTPVVLRT